MSIPVKGSQQVKATLLNVRQYDPSYLSCGFTGNVKVSITTPVNGIANLAFFGSLYPPYGTSVTQSGTCRMTLIISRKDKGATAWSDSTTRDSIFIPIIGHDRVRITSTAALRDWLKPFYSGGCLTDDKDGQLGITQVAGPFGGDCRVDILTTRNRTMPANRNFNTLPEGVIVGSAKWRTEGDSSVCTLCNDPTASCPGGQSAPLATPVQYTEDLIGPIINTQYEIQSNLLAIFTGPPQTPKDGRVNDPYSGVTIGYNTTNTWRSYLLTSYGRMTCNKWVPTPSDVEQVGQNAGNAAASVVNGIGAAVSNALGQNGGAAPQASQSATILPPPPALRLVLDSWEFYRPHSVRLPFEP